jgi:hypothetical protein
MTKISTVCLGGRGMFIQEALRTSFISEIEMPKTFHPFKTRPKRRLEMSGTKNPREWYIIPK